MSKIIVLVHNIRSTYNVGSILRTCEGFGVQQVILSGYTPYPKLKNDTRLPHIAEKMTKQIHKTALGAEELVKIDHSDDIFKAIRRLKSQSYAIIGLEQAKNSLKMQDFSPQPTMVLLLGEEVKGITPELLKLCDQTVEIPMFGQKESFNVSVATGIALYQFTLK
ncbi:TrmH family RNA methyltransferase [Candidatus Saccharibacteria bacterium]|nr:TrmH family RNA methyltransferase [Candidatus Saccharibacteria bacterium]